MTLESGILDIFFIEFRDPIFGLVVLVAAVLVIAVFSYAWGVFKSKDEKAEIAGFLKKFLLSDWRICKERLSWQMILSEAAFLCFREEISFPVP